MKENPTTFIEHVSVVRFSLPRKPHLRTRKLEDTPSIASPCISLAFDTRVCDSWVRHMSLQTIIEQSDADEYTTPPVSVAFAEGETTVCSVNGTKATITFAKDPGDLPPVYVKFNKLVSSEGVCAA